MTKKIRDDYGTFHVFMKKCRNASYKRTEIWSKKVDDFDHRMNECAFDIRTKDQVYQNKMESIYGPKKTA